MKGLWGAMAANVLLIACSGGSFKGNQTRNSDSSLNGLAADGSGIDGSNSSKELNPDGTPVIGPHAVTDFVKLSTGIDLLIAVDTSGSMKEESAAVQNNLVKIIQTLQTSKLDPMIHLMMSSRPVGDKRAPAPMPAATPSVLSADLDPTKIALIDQPIGSHDALGHLTHLLNGDYKDKYKDIKGQPLSTAPGLRAGAKIEILVISDDNGTNDQATSVSNLAKDFDVSNTFKATLSGIVGLPDSAQAAAVCQIAAVGQEYISLATKTGGSLLDICAKDWTVLIDRFSKDVVSRSASILLSQVPIDPASIIVNLDGKNLGPESWTYHAAENRVVLKPEVAFESGMSFGVNYDAKN